jgi:acyl-CoA synthetase (AMP-forming)/AMP-acid ligase II
MPPVPSDFFATGAQLIATAVLVFVVESALLRPSSRPSWGHTVVTALLFHCIFGMTAAMRALAVGGTQAHAFLTSTGLGAAAILVLLPPLLRLARASNERDRHLPVWKATLLDTAVLAAAVLVVFLVALVIAIAMVG